MQQLGRKQAYIHVLTKQAFVILYMFRITTGPCLIRTFENYYKQLTKNSINSLSLLVNRVWGFSRSIMRRTGEEASRSTRTASAQLTSRIDISFTCIQHILQYWAGREFQQGISTFNIRQTLQYLRIRKKACPLLMSLKTLVFLLVGKHCKAKIITSRTIAQCLDRNCKQCCCQKRQLSTTSKTRVSLKS